MDKVIGEIDASESSDRADLSKILTEVEKKHKLTKFQKFIVCFIKDYQSYKKDLSEIIFETLERYQRDCDYQLDIIARLKEFKEYEPLLYKDRTYRDHLIHVFQVFLLGMYIMEKIRIDKESDSKLGKYLSDKDKRARTYMLRYYAALFHDVCYPVEKATGSLEQLAFKYLVQDVKPATGKPTNPFSASLVIRENKDYRNLPYLFNTCIYNIVKNSSQLQDKHEARTLLCGKLIELFYRSYDHGIASAINLCHLMEKNKSISEANRTTIYKAVMAIALHTYRVIKEIQNKDATTEDSKLPFILKSNNMLRLLIYCDNVQEWGRPRGEFHKPHQDVVKLSDISVDSTAHTVTINLECHDKDKGSSLNQARENLSPILSKAERSDPPGYAAPTGHTSDLEWKFIFNIIDSLEN